MGRTAISNPTGLRQPIYLKSGCNTNVIATVADAARVIVHVPARYGSLAMTLAGSAPEAVDEHPGLDHLLEHATLAVHFAMLDGGLLQEIHGPRA